MRLEYFEMIDRVVSVDPDAGTLRVEANVPLESTVFEGHFPGYPVVPGALLLETMAQAAGFLILRRTQMERMPFFAGVRSAKFRKFVLPGSALDVTATLIHDGSGYAVTSGEVRVGGDVAAECEVTLRLTPFLSAELEAAIRGRAERTGLFAPTDA